MVFEVAVEIKDDSTSVTTKGDGKPRYVGQLKDHDQVVAWKVEDDASELTKRAEGKVRKDAEEAGFRQILLPISKAYWNAAPAQRPAILARIILAPCRVARDALVENVEVARLHFREIGFDLAIQVVGLFPIDSPACI